MKQQHCGHDKADIVNGKDGTSYCRECENEGSFEQWLDGVINDHKLSGNDSDIMRIFDVENIAREAFTRGRKVERANNEALQHGAIDRQAK